MTQTLSIRLLGKLSLAFGDSELTGVHTARLQALLAYLLLHRNATQSRQQLAFLFWPDTSETQAQTNLRQLLHTLRQRLPESDSFLEITDKTVRWRADAPCTLDVVEFESALLAASQTEGSERMMALERAIAVYGGDLVPGCYDDWLLLDRERLALRFVDALDQFILLLEQHRDYTRAIEYAGRLLRHDPLHEATYRRLMRFHALNGERGAALRVYHTCVTILEREVGVTPGAATSEVYERLLDLERRGAPAPVAPGTAHLVGRQGEWRTLQDGWRTVLRGNVRLVCLSGEAGIGKTRLAEELLHWAQQQGIATAATRAYAEGGSLAYAPLVELLRAAALRPRLSQMPAVWRSELARLLPELLVEDPKLPRPEPLTERWQVQRLYDAAGRVLLHAGGPLLLLLDDLQWFDTETIAWLHYLLHPDGRLEAERRHLPRLMVLAAMRTEEIDEGHPILRLLLDLRRSDRLTELALAPLTAVETAELAGQVADRRLDAGTAAAIHRATEGNPLFIVETVRSAPATAMGTVSLPLLQIAPRVQAVIQARLAQLSPAARELAGLAAAIGRAFDFDLLALASGQDGDTVVHSLDELWRRRIVREQEAKAYDFSHDSLRDVAYSELSPARRRLFHGRLARALEAIHVHDTAPVSAQLAHHYELAGQNERAIHHLHVAAANASRVYAYRESIALLNHALALLHSLPPSATVVELELELQMALCAAWAAVTDFLGEEVAVAYRRGLELCRQVQHVPHLFTVLWGLHMVALYRTEYRESLELAQQCLRIAEELDDPGLRLEAHHAAWGPYYFLGEYGQAFRHMEDGLALYDHAAHESLSVEYGVHDAGGCALTLSAMGLWNLGHIDQARRKLDAAIALGDRLALPANVADVYGHCGLILHLLREPQRAQTLAEKALQINSQNGGRFSGLLGGTVLGWSLAMQGQVTEGIALIEQTMAASEQFGELLHRSQFAAMLAEAYLAAGRYEEAVAASEEGIREFHRSRNLVCAPDLWTLKGEAQQALGGTDDQVEACYQAALALAGELGAKVSELRAAVSLARLRQRQSLPADGYDVLAKAYGWFSEGFESVDLRRAGQLLGGLSFGS